MESRARVEIFSVVLAAVAVAAAAAAAEEDSTGSTVDLLAPLACAASSAAAEDDKDVLKLAAKLIPLMQEQLKDPAVLKEIKNIKGTFAMNVTQDGKTAGTWWMTVYGADKPPVIGEGKPTEKPVLGVTISDDLMLKLAVGKANPVTSFMSGKIKLTGNIMMAQKLEALFRTHNGYERTRTIALEFAKDNAYLRSKL